MSISFKLKEIKDEAAPDGVYLYLEVLSDALVVARVYVGDWDDRWDMTRKLAHIRDELDEWGQEIGDDRT